MSHDPVSKFPLKVITLGLMFLFFAHYLFQGEASLQGPDTLEQAKASYLNNCSKCHGIDAGGDKKIGSPSLAGLPLWYTSLQIKSFLKGHRGAKDEDVPGNMMRVHLKSVDENETVLALEYLTVLSPVQHEPTLSGNLSNGKRLYHQHCSKCHRYNASGEKIFKSSPLVTFQDWYLLEQLNKFSVGLRGYHPEDHLGQKMKSALSNNLESMNFNDMITYICRLNHDE